ncbi:two-component system response regulator [Ideonella sp. 4Y11]|uniref:Two-component system response regulator n=1 Tax=Ideonella aquatica TaxID=2824119 RepID=A0A940YK71_9BURK|nr:two-component system response regulator [Ideonella aquatica]MBQ0961044.1 two-component system response regulator [Ideonella aquatica]
MVTTEQRATLLVVDDTPANLNLLAGLLNSEHRVKLANTGARALEIALREPPDLVLLDVMMPEMDGFEVCRRLKADARTRDVPVIFVTAMSQPEDEARGFEVGGADFIHKPISPPILRSRVRTHLQVKASRDALKRRNAGLAEALAAQLDQVERLRDATMFVMVSLAEFRDQDTGNHVKRTQEYVRALAEYLSEHPGDDADAVRLDAGSIELLAKSAPLHDIGKVAIPDHILLKPGKLDDADFEVMKTHTLQGWEILQRAAQRMGGASDFLDFARQIARHHHERWDGRGYPDGLAGRAIPLAARLMAVADVYDALISRRPYKDPLPHAQAMAMLADGAGQHFDPRIVAAAQACEDRFIDIARAWKD